MQVGGDDLPAVPRGRGRGGYPRGMSGAPVAKMHR